MTASSKLLLIDQVCRMRFEVVEFGIRMVERGLARFTGNEYRWTWEWDQEAVSRLGEGTLRNLDISRGRIRGLYWGRAKVKLTAKQKRMFKIILKLRGG